MTADEQQENTPEKEETEGQDAQAAKDEEKSEGQEGDKKDAAEGDGAEEEAGEGDGKKKKPKKKKRLFLIIGVVALLAIGGGAFMMLSGGKHEAEEGHVEEQQHKDYVFFNLPDILVNLHATGRKNNFLKVSISLELEDPKHIDLLNQLTPVIVDKFQIYLRGLYIDDLQGSEGLLRLREELLTRVNAVVYPARVNQVLFKEVLIQ